jgi:predicted secreted Zn-dependent protease
VTISPLLRVLAIGVLLAAVVACRDAGSGGGAVVDDEAPDVGPEPTVKATGTLEPQLLPIEERIRLDTKTSTSFYVVYGKTSQEILSFMTRYGPTTSDGERGLGIARPQVSLTWQPETHAASCIIDSMTISINVDVTLPHLAQQELLAPRLSQLWDELLSGIARHEQRHVDIYFEGMRQIRSELIGLQPRNNCAALEASVQGIWNQGLDRIQAAQDRFHDSEDARINNQKSSLKSQYESKDTRIAELRREIDVLDANIRSLETEMASLSNQAAPLQSQIEAIKAQYPDLVLPPAVAQLYESLRGPYNSILSQYEAAINQRRTLLSRRDGLAVEHDGLVEERNDLVDRYHLTP